MNEEQFMKLEARVSVLERNESAAMVTSANIDRRLQSIESSVKWLIQLVIGGFLTAMVALLMEGGILP